MEKVKPVFSKALLSCLRGIPASTVACKSSGTDSYDFIHFAHVNCDAAVNCVHLRFHGSARPPRRESPRHLIFRADLEDFADFAGRVRKANGIREGRWMVRLSVAVVFTNGVCCGCSRAEQRFGIAKCIFDAFACWPIVLSPPANAALLSVRIFVEDKQSPPKGARSRRNREPDPSTATSRINSHDLKGPVSQIDHRSPQYVVRFAYQFRRGPSGPLVP